MRQQRLRRLLLRIANRQHARDMHLLKHMLFIFIVFLIGWTPIYAISVVDLNGGIPYWVYLLLQLLPVLSSLVNVVDLFLYNHDLRQYLNEEVFKHLLQNRN